MPDILHLDELDVIADAHEEAFTELKLDITLVDSEEMRLLRSVVILTAAQYRRTVVAIDGDNVMGIAFDSVRLFRLVKARP